jgi:mRNA-degrading endonuclease YafQ of YafQ-DinJ toxin-antitoxin module
MKVEIKKSFDRALKKYNTSQKKDILESIQTLITSMENNQIPKGLGLKLLISKSRIWEARVNLDIRILFRFEHDLLEFGCVGNHDEIKRYLKTL